LNHPRISLSPQKAGGFGIKSWLFWLDMNISSLSSIPPCRQTFCALLKLQGARHEAAKFARKLDFCAIEKFIDESQGEKSNLWHIKSTNSQTSSQQHLVAICINA
jgi:hypothetical protein